MNLDVVMQRIDPSFSAGLPIGDELFSEYDLADDDGRPLQALRLEKRAKEQLALDLSLSKDVYSTQPLTKPLAELDHMLETMTEALTLHDELPLVEFSYFKPVVKRPYAKEADQDPEPGENDGPGQSLATRLLLKDWDVGTSVERYNYRDPYGTIDKPQEREPLTFHHWTSQELPPSQRPQTQSTLVQTQTAQPPTLLIATKSTAPPPVKKAESQTMPVAPLMRQGASQQNLRWKPTQTQESQAQSQTQSQEILMPSTQVLPGPFGGRPTTKKKAAKKRVGGF